MEALTRPKSRQKQSERTDAMKQRLLQATMDLIIEEGWAQTSTQKICKRAGVSRGAQTHHFPTKDSLLIAAVQEIVGRYQSQMDAALSLQNAPKPDLNNLFDFLWTACFDGPLLTCWTEAMVASRTDNTLGKVVRETDQRSLMAMRRLGENCDTGSETTQQNAADIVELTVYLLRGMVLQHGVHPNAEHRAHLFQLWKRLVLEKPA